MSGKNKDIPKRCIDPVIKYCEECEYGLVIYPEWVETYEDLHYCCYKTICMYGLEKTVPNEDELKEFDKWVEDMDKKREKRETGIEPVS